MKKAVKKISSKKIITISAIIVSIYLAILIVVTSLGQNKLKDSQYRELDLKVKSYASTLDNLFTIASEDVDNLSSDKTVQTFFANLASGMSMEYGLGASLINLKRRFDEKIDGKLINSSNIYNKLTLVGSDGTTIVTTGPKDLKPMDIHDLMTQHGHPEEVCATRDGDNIRIQVIKQVKFSGKPVAFLIADINKDIVIEQLTNQEHEDSYSRMVLKIKDVEMVVWDSITKNSTTNADENHFLSKVLDGKIYFEVPVEQHHFKLMAWFEPLNERDIFTSRLFIVGLSILA